MVRIGGSMARIGGSMVRIWEWILSLYVLGIRIEKHHMLNTLFPNYNYRFGHASSIST